MAARSSALALTFLSTLVPAVAAAQGTVQGRIAFENPPLIGEFSVSDAVVYLLGEGLQVDPQTVAATTDPPLLDQQDYTFVPRVLPVMAGVPVNFHNSDDETHNIHTRSKGRRRNRQFNQAQKPNSLLSTVFIRPDSIRVMCDIHSQMIAHILVLPNPFFTQPDGEGAFRIPDVPAGRYELMAWHEFYGTVTQTVEVKGEGVVAAHITMSR